ncbi:HECT-domain-containing protein [Hesseltinella vesiculosa]|uniref:HECT-type E3 ubiquitin transferase n=1 Tax=Hesseltinella vesiculosa TaxID=101127 RepID=A0A1X2G891_9FUNG|nr:HECT-domain-containing protein [Hesseltinella vesiculosa]
MQSPRSCDKFICETSAVSPRLNLLNHLPFVLPFEHRVQLFRLFIANDRHRLGIREWGRPKMEVQIRRDHVFEDGYRQLFPLGASLKDWIAISFIDAFGLPESGIDGGGVFKEFLTSLGQEAFNAHYGLFAATPDQLLYPQPSQIAIDANQLANFTFLGMIIGKALYEGILLDVGFADFFLKKCLGYANYLDDLPSLDPDLYKGLMQVKHFQGNVEDLCLDFSLTDNGMAKNGIHTVNLIPRGNEIQVTNENKIRYVYLVANYRLNVQIARQCKAFFNGLSTIIDPKWLRMFNQQEAQILMGGAAVPIDLGDLRRNTTYASYDDTDPTIQYLWQALNEFSNNDRMKFVKFVTSCARPPILGFKELQPPLCIRKAGDDETRLPTSSTCVNLLKLPAYTSYQVLKEKLLYSINAHAGFDLS